MRRTWLLLGVGAATGCTAAPPPAATESADSGEAEAADSGVGGAPDSGEAGPQPGGWSDPILHGADIDLGVSGPELTDAFLRQDVLALSGQEQRGDGGVWLYDVSDTAAPSLIARSHLWHVQRVCVDDTYVWGMTREGRLLQMAVSGDEVRTEREYNVASPGAAGAGLHCDGSTVAWGLGRAGGGVAHVEGAELLEIVDIPGEVQDVALHGDLMWTLAWQSLTAWSLDPLTQLGSVALEGSCQDLVVEDDRIVAACGGAGVSVIDPNGGQPILVGQWEGHVAARAVSIAGESALVAGWTDVIQLDIHDPTQPTLRATEPAISAAMAVAAGPDGAVFVADWNRPFVAHLQGHSAPEVHADARTMQPGGATFVRNFGTEPLWLGTPSSGTIDADVLAPGEKTVWRVGADAELQVSLPTDDPDEPTYAVAIGSLNGLQIGDPAPLFTEADMSGATWDLAALRGEVVFLGLFSEG